MKFKLLFILCIFLFQFLLAGFVSTQDVDNDGDLDLILHFDTQSLKLVSTDTVAVLTAKLNNGALIKGEDSVRIVK